MLLDSFEHAEEDVKARLLAEQRVEAERIAAAARDGDGATAPELLTAERARRRSTAALAALATARAGTRPPRDPRGGRGARPARPSRSRRGA